MQQTLNALDFHPNSDGNACQQHSYCNVRKHVQLATHVYACTYTGLHNFYGSRPHRSGVIVDRIVRTKSYQIEKKTLFLTEQLLGIVTGLGLYMGYVGSLF